MKTVKNGLAIIFRWYETSLMRNKEPFCFFYWTVWYHYLTLYGRCNHERQVRGSSRSSDHHTNQPTKAIMYSNTMKWFWLWNVAQTQSQCTCQPHRVFPTSVFPVNYWMSGKTSPLCHYLKQVSLILVQKAAATLLFAECNLIGSL